MRTKIGGVAVLALLMAAVTAGAVDIPLRNGQVVEAAAYKVTGSYVMVTRPDGSRVAYDVADVDLEALRRAEAAPAEAPAAPESRPPSIMDARAPEGRRQASVAITDQDVARAAPADQAAGGEAAEDGEGPPPGFTEGQGVVIEGIRVEQVEQGVWDVRGRVANRTPGSVDDVRIQLELFAGADQAIGSPTIELASTLATGEGVTFSHHVETAERPTVRARVYWLQTAADDRAPRPPGQTQPAPQPEAGEGGEAAARQQPTGSAY